MLESRTIAALLNDMVLPSTVSPPKLLHANPEEMESWKTRKSWWKLLTSWVHTRMVGRTPAVICEREQHESV